MKLYKAYVRGHYWVLGPTQTQYSTIRQARVKISSGKGPKYTFAQEHKLYCHYFHFGGH